MHVIHDHARGGRAGTSALVMLPGAGDRAQDFVDRGFVRALREVAPAIDVAIADARFDRYLEQSIVADLEREVLLPLRQRGIARPWLMGISLGGLGALACACEHPERVAGVVLLAPFLATRGVIAEATRAGGLQNWQPGPLDDHDHERRLLARLRDYRAGDPRWPPVWLGYGLSDRYAPASRLLAAQLPADRVITIDGGHDWSTWLALWRRCLAAGALREAGGLSA